MCSTRVMVCAPVPQPRSSTRSIDPRPSTKSSARLVDPTEPGPSRSRDLCSSTTRSSIEGADRSWCFFLFQRRNSVFAYFHPSAASLRLRKRAARPASDTASPASNRSAICAASSAFRDSSDNFFMWTAQSSCAFPYLRTPAALTIQAASSEGRSEESPPEKRNER